jgi:hypothetical protein
MAKIPPAVDSDSDDVAWALQTAATLVDRGEAQDALVWLRRAAQAAAEVDDARSLELARAAADYAETLAPTTEVERLSIDVDVDMATMRSSYVTSSSEADPDDEVVTSAPPLALLDRLRALRADSADSKDTEVEPPPVPAIAEPTLSSEADVQGATEAPRATPPAVPLPPMPPPPVYGPGHGVAGAASTTLDLDPTEPAEDVSALVLSGAVEPSDESLIELEPVSLDPASLANPVAPKAPAPPKLRPPPPPVPSPAHVPPAGTPELAAPTAPEPPVPPAQEFVVPPPPPAVERGLRHRSPSRLPKPGTKPPPLRFDEPLVPEDDSLTLSPPARTVRLPTPLPPHAEVSRKSAIDLSGADAFADMPDDTRVEFERQAELHELHTDEEVSGFALAWVESGELAVMSLVSDIPAVVLAPGHVLRSRGTVDERVPLRLVCSSDTARVATWSEDAVAVSFEALPWVEEDLRAEADRTHALIGVTLGPLGEAFGPALLEEITSRLQPKHFIEGETVVSAGEGLPGLLILGVGVLDVVNAEGGVASSLDVGTILFPGSLLSMDGAPATVRAGRGGAVVLMVERAAAQEMIMTFPPLLEQLTRG